MPQIYLVGGAIRDALRGEEPHECDFVVTQATEEDFINNTNFSQLQVGFPVFIQNFTQQEYALARKEIKTGSGYSSFTFDTNNISLSEDYLRRDFTINSLYLLVSERLDEFLTIDGDLIRDLKDNIIDPTGKGIADLSENPPLLRAVSATFWEDPVRFLRGLRFVATKGYQLDKTILDDVDKQLQPADQAKLFSTEHAIRQEILTIAKSGKALTTIAPILLSTNLFTTEIKVKESQILSFYQHNCQTLQVLSSLKQQNIPDKTNLLYSYLSVQSWLVKHLPNFTSQNEEQNIKATTSEQTTQTSIQTTVKTSIQAIGRQTIGQTSEQNAASTALATSVPTSISESILTPSSTSSNYLQIYKLEDICILLLWSHFLELCYKLQYIPSAQESKIWLENTLKQPSCASFFATQLTNKEKTYILNYLNLLATNFILAKLLNKEFLYSGNLANSMLSSLSSLHKWTASEQPNLLTPWSNWNSTFFFFQLAEQLTITTKQAFSYKLSQENVNKYDLNKNLDKDQNNNLAMNLSHSSPTTQVTPYLNTLTFLSSGISLCQKRKSQYTELAKSNPQIWKDFKQEQESIWLELLQQTLA